MRSFRRFFTRWFFLSKKSLKSFKKLKNHIYFTYSLPKKRVFDFHFISLFSVIICVYFSKKIKKNNNWTKQSTLHDLNFDYIFNSPFMFLITYTHTHTHTNNNNHNRIIITIKINSYHQANVYTHTHNCNNFFELCVT